MASDSGYVDEEEEGEEKERKALIVLFGWAGCQQRLLAKYEDIYRREGFSVLPFIVPVDRIRSFSSYRPFAVDIYDALVSMEKEGHGEVPVIFHLFSMNGCSLFASLWLLLDEMRSEESERIKTRTRGIIFDSSPALVSVWQSAKAVTYAMYPGIHPLGSWLLRLALSTAFSLHRLRVWWTSLFQSNVHQRSSTYYILLEDASLPNEMLFIYSVEDDICSASTIEAFREHQRSKWRVNVQSLVLDSPHCQHLRFYSKDYTDKCLQFVRHLIA